MGIKRLFNKLIGENVQNDESQRLLEEQKEQDGMPYGIGCLGYPYPIGTQDEDDERLGFPLNK